MTEIKVVTRPMPRPINTEKRAPTTVWRNTSSPKLVVPNQCAADGGCSTSLLKVCGSCRRMIGPKMASKIKKATTSRPTLALRFLDTSCQTSRQRCTWAGITFTSGEGKLISCDETVIFANFLPGARADQAVHTKSRPGSSRPAQQG